MHTTQNKIYFYIWIININLFNSIKNIRYIMSSISDISIEEIGYILIYVKKYTNTFICWIKLSCDFTFVHYLFR